MTARPLTALLLSDGKPGHYHQSEGVIAAIEKIRPVTTIRMDIRRRALVPTRTLQQLFNIGLSPAFILWLGYGLHARSLPPADLVVSAGGETIAANAAVAKRLRVLNVFCGRLRRMNPSHFALVIVSLDEFADFPNHLVALPPSPFDIERPGADANIPRLGATNPPRVVGVLIGGNSGTVTYTRNDWAALMRFLTAAHAAHGARWLISTSRRSGAYIGDELAAMTAKGETGIVRFVDYRSSGPGTLREILAQADAVLCTDDSTTMVSEAVGARLPVVAVTPKAMWHEPRELAYRQRLADNDWYRATSLEKLTPATFLELLDQIAPRTTSQLEELAAALRQRLPGLFGS